MPTQVITTEVAIVGQGLAGSMLACELFMKGIDFRIYNPAGSMNASNAAGGLFYPLAARKMREIDNLTLLYPIMEKQFRAIEKMLGESFLKRVDSAKLFAPSEIESWIEARNTTLSAHISDIKNDFSAAGIRTGFAAAIIANSGYVELSRYTRVLAKFLLQKNWLIEAPIDLHAIKPQKNGIKVTEELTARHLVFCQGPGHQGNPWFPGVKIGQNKGELIDIYAPGLESRYILRGEGIFILPLGEGRFRAGATFSHHALDWQPTAEGLAELTQKLDRLLSLKYEVTGHWAGIRPTTLNRQPVLGQHHEHKGLYIFNGLGSRGVLQAPYYAQQLVKSMASGKPEWSKSIDAARFA